MMTPQERLAEALAGIDARYERRRRLHCVLDVLLWVALALAAGFALAGCPKPGPAPVTPPDASDAAPPPTCAVACQHVEAELRCPTNGACGDACAKVKRVEFRRCIAAAATCADVDRCDR